MSEVFTFDLSQAIEDDSSLNLSIITSPEGLLLGTKNRGFGEGSLVLPGGKEKYMIHGISMLRRRTVDDITEELFEETGLSLPGSSFRQSGMLYVEDEDAETRDIVLARAELPHAPTLQGSDEFSNPEWFPTGNLPYDRMPFDYPLWLPHVLSGKIVTAFLVNIETDFKGSQIYLTNEDPTKGPGSAHTVYNALVR